MIWATRSGECLGSGTGHGARAAPQWLACAAGEGGVRWLSGSADRRIAAWDLKVRSVCSFGAGWGLPGVRHAMLCTLRCALNFKPCPPLIALAPPCPPPTTTSMLPAQSPGTHSVVLPEQLGSRAKSIAISADGSAAAVALFDSTVAVFDVASGGRLAQLIRRGDRDASRVHSGGVNAVYLSRSGDLAVTVSKDCTARVWDVMEAAATTRGGDGASTSGSGAAGGGNGGAAGGAAADVRGTDGEGERALSNSGTHLSSSQNAAGLPPHSGSPQTLAPAAAAFAFLSAAPNKPRRASAPPAATEPIGQLGNFLLGGSSTSASGAAAAAATEPAAAAARERFSCSSIGHQSSSSGTSRLSGPAISSTVLAGHCDSVVAAALSPDERQLATASFDGTARVWDLATGACLKVCFVTGWLDWLGWVGLGWGWVGVGLGWAVGWVNGCVNKSQSLPATHSTDTTHGSTHHHQNPKP